VSNFLLRTQVLLSGGLGSSDKHRYVAEVAGHKVCPIWWRWYCCSVSCLFMFPVSHRTEGKLCNHISPKQWGFWHNYKPLLDAKFYVKDTLRRHLLTSGTP